MPLNEFQVYFKCFCVALFLFSFALLSGFHGSVDIHFTFLWPFLYNCLIGFGSVYGWTNTN